MRRRALELLAVGLMALAAALAQPRSALAQAATGRGGAQARPGAALVAAEDARIRALDRLALGAAAQLRSPLGGGAIVLPARLLAWTLPQLMSRFPGAFT